MGFQCHKRRFNLSCHYVALYIFKYDIFSNPFHHCPPILPNILLKSLWNSVLIFLLKYPTTLTQHLTLVTCDFPPFPEYSVNSTPITFIPSLFHPFNFLFSLHIFIYQNLEHLSGMPQTTLFKNVFSSPMIMPFFYIMPHILLFLYVLSPNSFLETLTVFFLRYITLNHLLVYVNKYIWDTPVKLKNFNVTKQQKRTSFSAKWIN